MLATVMSRMDGNVDLVMSENGGNTGPGSMHRAIAEAGCTAAPFPRKRRLRRPSTLSSRDMRSSNTASHTSGGDPTIRCRDATAIAMPFSEDSKRCPLFGKSTTRCETGELHEEEPRGTATCPSSHTTNTESASQGVRNEIHVVWRERRLKRMHLSRDDRGKDREKIGNHPVELDANRTDATGRKALDAARKAIPRIPSETSTYTPWYCINGSSALRRDRMTWKRLDMR